MKAFSVGFVCLVALLGPGVRDASAQLNCGSIETYVDIFQSGYSQYVWVQLATSREVALCPMELQTEGWVGGVGGAGVSRHTYSATLSLGRPIPYHGVWHAFSKHWLIMYPGTPGQQWTLWAEKHDEVLTTPPPDPPDEGGGGDEGSGEEDCWAGGGSWENEHCVWPNCPLLIDVDGDGFQLTSAANGVRFDLDSDGTPEQIAWTRRDSDDAWLVLDRNGNGRVDDGTELFGNFTPAYADRPQPGSENGFVALRFTEGPSYGRSMADNVIDASDAVFRRLLLWRDTNHNGISEPHELTPAHANGLASLSTDYRESRRRDRFGNEYRQVTGSLWRTAHGWQRRLVVDVWLKAIQ